MCREPNPNLIIGVAVCPYEILLLATYGSKMQAMDKSFGFHKRWMTMNADGRVHWKHTRRDKRRIRTLGT